MADLSTEEHFGDDKYEAGTKAYNKELEKNKRKLNMLRETNSNIIEEIESLGQGIDLAIPRFEHFTVFLVEIGVITEEQLIESQLVWERNLKEQIVPVVQALREKRRVMQEELRKRQAEQDKNAKNAKRPTRVMLDTKPQGTNDPSASIIIPDV